MNQALAFGLTTEQRVQIYQFGHEMIHENIRWVFASDQIANHWVAFRIPNWKYILLYILAGWMFMLLFHLTVMQPLWRVGRHYGIKAVKVSLWLALIWYLWIPMLLFIFGQVDLDAKGYAQKAYGDMMNQFQFIPNPTESKPA
jgi:hypothetical protein